LAGSVSTAWPARLDSWDRIESFMIVAHSSIVRGH
jgi:hypothetical protein